MARDSKIIRHPASFAATPGKTVRFAEVVKAAGRPETHALWVEPRKDAVFQRALKETRLMSVHEDHRGTKADFGSIGYEPDRKAEFLIFPKSLQRFASCKIIGIKFDLLDPGKPGGYRAPRPPKPKKSGSTRPKLAPSSAHENVAPKTVAADPPKEMNRVELLRGVKRAMALLDKGKTVAAYHALEALR